MKTDDKEALFFFEMSAPLFPTNFGGFTFFAPFFVFWFFGREKEREILTLVASLDRGLGREEGEWGSARCVLYLEIIPLA